MAKYSRVQPLMKKKTMPWISYCGASQMWPKRVNQLLKFFLEWSQSRYECKKQNIDDVNKMTCIFVFVFVKR